jgi:hypothetical protein
VAINLKARLDKIWQYSKMGKKCISGVICVENMTLFIMMVILLIVSYLYYSHYVKSQANDNKQNNIYLLLPPNQATALNTSIGTKNDPLTNLNAPPSKDATYFRRDSGDVRGIPVNVETRSANDNYRQMGILTRASGSKGDLILPLMGRQLTTGTYKWQYYTMTTSGNLNTKLPISVNGRSCTSEYGCDSISNGDIVYVEGYSDTFRVTLYESSLFQYIPFL